MTFSKLNTIKKYLKNRPIWIKISHSDLYLKLRNPKAYEQKLKEHFFYTQLISSVQGQNTLIFDVGANVGNKSSIFSKLTQKVLAFEPSSNMCYILNHRFKNTNVHVFNCALGNVDDSLDFYEIGKNEAYNSLSKKHIETTVIDRSVANSEDINVYKIEVKKIENFISKYGNPIYIKIDVEGYEYQVIQGLKTIVPIISFELNLPEFQHEALLIVDYLDKISGGKYVYNFADEPSFLLPKFVDKNAAIKFLELTELRYMEVYAKLENNKH